MARPGKLDEDRVIELREAYAHQRNLADNDPDPQYAATITETEARLARLFGISQPMVRRIVLGLSYANVGGPLDERRRAVAKEVVNETPPTAVRVTIQRPGATAKSYVHPPGTVVTVEGITEDPASYAESGLPIKAGKAKAAPKDDKAPKKRPSQMSNEEHRRYRAEVARREAEHGEADSVASSRGGSSAWMLAGE